MNDFTVFDTFSGIGGFSLGLESVGFRTVAFSEVDPDANRVLRYHWPYVQNLGDIRDINTARFLAAYGSPMVVTGGVPCQPASFLGNQRGTSDERWLWPDFIRIVRELRPRYVIAENPPAILVLEQGRAWNGIVSELVASGYDCQWDVFPAAAFGAGHLRERLYLVATNSDSPRLEGHAGDGEAGGKTETRRPVAPPDLREIKIASEMWWQAQSPVQPVVDGLPGRLVESALRCVGNSVVPQIPALIGKGILDQIKGDDWSTWTASIF
jgi:DNA (cytosine-5)-methyltransferase 1